MNKIVKNFASDNNSGVIPEVFEALKSVNQGHVHAYGGDEYTQKCIKEFKKHFGEHTKVFLCFNGTAANLLALSPFLKAYESVICAETSHLHNDECGAPEKILGTKLITIPAKDGKIQPNDIQKHLIRKGDQHFRQPKVISITQPTEYGTLYSLDELKELSQFAKENQLYFHMDGSRLVNAAASLNVSLKEITSDVGLDSLSFGGTKNGLMGAEAIVIFNSQMGGDFKYLHKQLLQLPGKCRYLAAQFLAFFKNETWLKNARHCNAMAEYLGSKLNEISEVKITQKIQANSVFAILPKNIIHELKKSFFFYVWDENTFECRLMTTFDTTKTDIDDFVNKIQDLLNTQD